MKYFSIFIFVVMISFAFSLPAFAFPSLVPADCRGDATIGTGGGDCNLADVEGFAINIANVILGVTGSITLLMFVYGGVMYMISGGSPDKVKKATEILRNSVIGLSIILLAGLAVQVLLKKLSS